MGSSVLQQGITGLSQFCLKLQDLFVKAITIN